MAINEYTADVRLYSCYWLYKIRIVNGVNYHGRWRRKKCLEVYTVQVEELGCGGQTLIIYRRWNRL